MHPDLVAIVMTVCLPVLTVVASIFLTRVSNVKRLEDELGKMRADHIACLKKNGQQEVELANYLARLRNLETMNGVDVSPPLAGVVVSDISGMIRLFSPSLTPVLKYLPKQVVGRPLASLFDSTRGEPVVAEIARVLESPNTADPGREHLCYMVTATGESVPVAVTIEGWKAGEAGLVNLIIRRRPTTPGSMESGVRRVQPPLLQD